MKNDSKSVIKLLIETCSEYGGAVKLAALARPCARGIRASMHIITCMDAGGQSREDPAVIEKRLTHLNEKAASTGTGLSPEKFAGSEFSRKLRMSKAHECAEQGRAPPQAVLFD